MRFVRLRPYIRYVKMWYDGLSEFAALALSSAGLVGALLTSLLGILLKRAKSEAIRRRGERLKLDIMRLDGEEKLSELIYAMVRQSRGCGSAAELDEAFRAYGEYLETARRMKNEILSFYTIK